MDSNININSNKWKRSKLIFHLVFGLGWAIIFGVIALITHMNSPATKWEYLHDAKIEEQYDAQYSEYLLDKNEYEQKVRKDYTEPITLGCTIKQRILYYNILHSLDDVFTEDLVFSVYTKADEYIEDVQVYAKIKIKYLDIGNNIKYKDYIAPVRTYQFNRGTFDFYIVPKYENSNVISPEVESLTMYANFSTANNVIILPQNLYNDKYASNHVESSIADEMANYEEFVFDKEIADVLVIADIGEKPVEDSQTKTVRTVFIVLTLVALLITIVTFIPRVLKFKGQTENINSKYKDYHDYLRQKQEDTDCICEYCLTKFSKSRNKCPNCGSSRVDKME